MHCDRESMHGRPGGGLGINGRIVALGLDLEAAERPATAARPGQDLEGAGHEPDAHGPARRTRRRASHRPRRSLRGCRTGSEPAPWRTAGPGRSRSAGTGRPRPAGLGRRRGTGLRSSPGSPTRCTPTGPATRVSATGLSLTIGGVCEDRVWAGLGVCGKRVHSAGTALGGHLKSSGRLSDLRRASTGSNQGGGTRAAGGFAWDQACV